MKKKTDARAWRTFLLECELAKHHDRTALLHAFGRFTPNPLIARLFPGLLYIKACALLDEILSRVVDAKRLPVPKPLKRDLNGHITVLGRLG